MLADHSPAVVEQYLDKFSQSVGALMMGSLNPQIRSWAKGAMAYLGRYALAGSRPQHKSATCEVWRALDMQTADQVVALEIVSDFSLLQPEVELRHNAGAQLDPELVMAYAECSLAEAALTRSMVI